MTTSASACAIPSWIRTQLFACFRDLVFLSVRLPTRSTAATTSKCDATRRFRFSKQMPIFFLINLATGGGWPVDLSRHNGVAGMYVDFVSNKCSR